MREYSKVFSYRSLVYLVVLSTVAIFSPMLLSENASISASRVFAIFTLVAFGQVFLSFKTLLSEWVALVFFLSDAAVIMVLVRVSGSSASPFLVLYPLLVLGCAIVFKPLLSGIITGATLVFMYFSIGSSVSILGNSLAILMTAFLGMYLVSALDSSGVALKKSEGARRRLENLQKAILANIPSGLMSIDSEGRIIQVNAVGLRILNLNEGRVLGSHIRNLLPGLDVEILKLNTLVPRVGAPEDLADLVGHGDRPIVNFNLSSGDTLQLGYSVARLSDPEDKSIIGSLLVFQDLTDILKMEESLRLSEKLAAIGKLAAAIAHEIRNPLASISGSAQLLSDVKQISDEDKKLLSIIQRESTRLDELITEFLEYVHPHKPKMEPINLYELCERVVDGLKVNAKWKALNTSISISPRSSRTQIILGDTNKITQALLNFIFNSGQAGATKVELGLESAHRLEVRDNGSGISLENKKRLFEPFFTTKERGTGLGLATSYRALQSMRAEVSVSSPALQFCEKGGTIFSIHFNGG